MSYDVIATGNELITEALRFYALGDVPIPMHLGTKRPCIKWSQYLDKPPSEDEVREWFADNDVNLGLLLRGSHYVRDFDEPGSYERWVRGYPLAATSLPTVETGRGYEVHAQASESISGAESLGDGELRGAGVLVVVPPSVHETGVPYQWRIPLTSGLPF